MGQSLLLSEQQGRDQMTIHVFVYGSLKKGFGNHSCLGKSLMVKEDALKSAYLVDLGSFPGMFQGDGEVHGEVYEVSPAIMSRLDLLEGHPNFYRREVVTLNSGMKAWSYYLNQKYKDEGYNVVTNGKWLQK